MFTIIIPTYNRSVSVVMTAIRSLLKDEVEFKKQVARIVVVDQNQPILNFSELPSALTYQKIDHFEGKKSIDSMLVHVYGVKPSLTHAKNVALNYAIDENIFILDDDIELKVGSLTEAAHFLNSHPEVSFVGGRETVVPAEVGKSALREILVKLISWLRPSEPAYAFQGHYIGRITAKSFFICDFSQDSAQPVRIDTARGCNWAAKKQWVIDVGGFDENFSGSAIREESDIHLRLARKFGPGFYLSKVHVLHYRQLGGCDNLNQSIRSLESKLKNEAYFQKKHFPEISKVWFFLRLLPLMIKNFRETRGQSFILLLKRTWAL